MYLRSGWIWSELKGEWPKMKAEARKVIDRHLDFVLSILGSHRKVWSREVITVLFLPTKGLSQGQIIGGGGGGAGRLGH